MARIPTRLFRPLRTPHIRPFSSTSSHLANGQETQSQKEAIMDKDAINTSSNEYAKTGAGDGAAAHTSKAFDPGDTSPESQHEGVKGEAGDANPVEVSPGNHSPGSQRIRDSQEAETGEARTATSGPGAGGAKGTGMGKK